MKNGKCGADENGPEEMQLDQILADHPLTPYPRNTSMLVQSDQRGLRQTVFPQLHSR